ncbi:MAG: TrkH family potassium uptake protein [Clostridia bacterium]
MNFSIVIKVLGKILSIQALLMIPSLIVATVYREEKDVYAFAVTMLLLLLVSFFTIFVKGADKKVQVKEAMLIVTLGWILVSFFGSLPYLFSGSIPSFTDAYFESMSGFTTTGASILDNVEELPPGILFWRAFTNWIGGMGIIVFTLALLPALGMGGMKIFKAEVTGPVTDKIMPRLKDTAKTLYFTYGIITIVGIVLLTAGGMTFYDACIHTFGSVGNGGFSSKQNGLGAYDSTFIQLTAVMLMIVSGINYNLYYALYKRKWSEIKCNHELKLYFGIILGATLLIASDLFFNGTSSLGISLRDAFFQVGSITTTAGYTTVNYDRWSTFSKIILFALMFIGGCAGSTSGGIKVIRIMVMLKLVKREIRKIFHPRSIMSVKIGERALSDDTLFGIAGFVFLYILTFIFGTLIISIQGVDIITSASAVVASLSNIGPGMNLVGPTGSYALFNNFNTWVLSFLMLLGRLELFTVIAAVTPKRWGSE